MVLPVPAGLQALLDCRPQQFYAGCAAARDGWDEDSNPCRPGSETRRAWAAGWLSVREGWVEALDHGGRDAD